MVQSFLVLSLAIVMIIPIIFATPFQQSYTNSQTGDTQADEVPSFLLGASYDGDQAAALDSSSTSEPALFANNQLDWLKNFFVPPPPPWQGTDENIAAQFTCEASTAYCCTGRYDAERKYALQPCYYCTNPIYIPSAQHLKTDIKKIMATDNPVTYECQNQFNIYCCTGTSVQYSFSLALSFARSKQKSTDSSFTS